MSEEKTKGIVSDKLKKLKKYPQEQDTINNGIIWFKEDSYKSFKEYNWITETLKTASKNQMEKSSGTPDFIVYKNNDDIIQIIECKGKTKYHSSLDDISDFANLGYGTEEETKNYAINGVLYYASYFSDKYDVVATAVSGQTKSDLRITSFIWPKRGRINDIAILEDGNEQECFTALEDYKDTIRIVLDRDAEEHERVRRELRKYTLACASFLRANGIEDNLKAGFVSAIILGLTNKESELFKIVEQNIIGINNSKTKKFNDTIGRNAVDKLKHALYGEGEKNSISYINGIFDIDNIPEGKRTSLKKFYDSQLLSKDELQNAPKQQGNYFKYGDTVLSACIYSLYINVICVLEHYQGIDVMGEFYTTFLRFTKGNAKEKGIVLTPKHITDLFCDIAEYYGEKLTENTKIVDICCGTGAFLISSLERIRKNINSRQITNDQKKEAYALAQKQSLIGVEKDSSMYALAYANMRFHGDGKSNLFNCSSLMSDSYNPIDASGETYVDGQIAHLSDALKTFGEIDFGMINPPYSLAKNDDRKAKERNYPEGTPADVVIQKGQDELDFIASMLHYLKKGGIGIAIVPMSCAGNSGAKLRKGILKNHTLLACMTMPNQLFFDSHVGTATCIMVFKAHFPHDENKAVFFGRWLDDGFKVIPHNGRKDAGKWRTIEKKWINQIDGIAQPNDKVFVNQKIKITDEALAEAYIKTDYSKLTEKNFEKTLKKYALFKYMDENALMEE
jgi:type I restriction enzyme M protein